MQTNIVEFEGNIVSELREGKTGQGRPVGSVRLANDHLYTVKGEPKKSTTYVGVTVFGEELVKPLRGLKPGSAVRVKGRLSSSSYKDKKYPDVTHYSTDITADAVEVVKAR